MKVYVIRHGETDANLSGVFQGRSDTRLLESGRNLARITGEALRGLRFDAAFTSPLSRARDTAAALLEASGNGGAPLREDSRLLEIDMGEFEGRGFRPGEREVDPELCRLFFEDPFAFPGFPGGETVRAVCARTSEFRDWLVRQEFGDVLVSTHGFALRALLNPLYPDPGDFWQGHVPYNCSVSIFESSGQVMRLLESDAIYYDKRLCVDRYAAH